MVNRKKKSVKNDAKRRNKILFRITLALVILAGAFLIVRSVLYGEGRKPRYMALPAVPEITLVHCHLSGDTAHFKIHCILQNKGVFVINIDSVYLNLSLGKQLFVSEEQKIGLRQRPGQRDSVVLTVDLPFKELKARIESLKGQKTTEIGVDTKVVYKTIAGSKRVGFTKHHKIDVPVPPQLKVLGVRKEEIRLLKKEAEVTLFLQIINHGKQLDVAINEFHYDININNELKAGGKIKEPVLLQPGKTTLVRFPGNFKIKSPLKTLTQIVFDNDRLPFDLKISGYVSSKKINKLPVLITASGMVELRNEDKPKSEKKKLKDL